MSWYSDCHRPALPRLPSLTWVRKCIWVVFSHTKKGVPLSLALGDEAERLGDDLVVNGLHPLLGERAGVLDLLSAVTLGPGVNHAAGTEVLAEVGELLLTGIVVQLGLLLGVEVVEVAEELIEPVGRREEVVAVPEVVLAELSGGVAQGLQRGGDRRVLGPQADVGPGMPTLVRPVR